MTARSNQVGPILSICIPTYNRARLLQSALDALLKEIQPHGGMVEVVVCDNNSQDDTAIVIERFSGQPGFRHARNPANLGAAANIVRLVRELALGKYIWVIGDDDLVVVGAVERLLAIIESHPGVDALFLNHTYLQVENRGEFAEAMSAPQPKAPGAPLCHSLEDKLVSRWEDIIEFTNTPAAFTSIICHIATAEVWRRVTIEPSTLREFADYETTFPHLAILAPSLVGHPVFYVGKPQVTMLLGAQEWFNGHWPRLLFTHVLEFSHQLEQYGAPVELTALYRDRIFDGTLDSFLRVVSGNMNLGSKLSLVAKLIGRYASQRSFRQLIISTMRAQKNLWLRPLDVIPKEASDVKT